MSKLDLGLLEITDVVVELVNGSDLNDAINRHQRGDYGTLDQPLGFLKTAITLHHMDRFGMAFNIFTCSEFGERQTFFNINPDTWRRHLESKR